ncbi:MAG: hypothetical protein KAH96_05865, partial [Alphaproteobacteria bacterium]|nr:hypothetical protein [Alphaproteobacteria bacterium]
MSEVTLTAAMRANLLSLQSTASLMGQTQYRLATGNKVNSALDNPTSFFAAQSLNNRASDLSSLLDGMGQNIQVLKAASQGIESLLKLVNTAKAVAHTAQAEATGGAMFTGSEVRFDAVGQANIVGYDGGSGGAITAAQQFTMQVGSGPVTTFTIGASETLQSLLDQLNMIDGISATTIEDPLGAQGDVNIQIRTTNGENVTFDDVGAGTLIDDIFGGDGTFLVPGASIAGVVQVAATVTPTDRVALEKQYNDLITQINEFITDTGYRGKNLLNGDVMRTQFNEDNSSSMSVTGMVRDAAGLGMLAANFGTSGTIQTNLDEITSALDTLRSDGRSYGNALAVITTRQDFTKNLIATLKDGATALTIADKNEEGANLLSLQTSQQLGIQA